MTGKPSVCFVVVTATSVKVLGLCSGYLKNQQIPINIRCFCLPFNRHLLGRFVFVSVVPFRMDEHIQSYSYVKSILDQIVKYRRSSDIAAALHYNTKCLLAALENTTDIQDNAEQLKSEPIMPVTEAGEEALERLGITDEKSFDELRLLIEILKMKEKCAVAKIVEKI
ncbi:unnamed protein product [Acanthoscelides obtectus]|uniref:Uncharacterized protein n=1 Tax=Acanthoscelides obtectus TaxID=200917 RepID=A0A9P0PJK8_ACAOB|nr:unnamed protein product [Acanthoscelides obtectus]CAK1636317.1 hypothetical protein AOBTE_LOCUS9808 [Acanthoscelides obtectus]